MDIESLSEYRIIEWNWNFWININLLNEYRIFEWNGRNIIK